jgi:hypothetical protein
VQRGAYAACDTQAPCVAPTRKRIAEYLGLAEEKALYMTTKSPSGTNIPLKVAVSSNM